MGVIIPPLQCLHHWLLLLMRPFLKGPSLETHKRKQGNSVLLIHDLFWMIPPLMGGHSRNQVRKSTFSARAAEDASYDLTTLSPHSWSIATAMREGYSSLCVVGIASCRERKECPGWTRLAEMGGE